MKPVTVSLDSLPAHTLFWSYGQSRETQLCSPSGDPDYITVISVGATQSNPNTPATTNETGIYALQLCAISYRIHADLPSKESSNLLCSKGDIAMY